MSGSIRASEKMEYDRLICSNSDSCIFVRKYYTKRTKTLRVLFVLIGSLIKMSFKL